MEPIRAGVALRGMATASVSLGFFSLCVFWWFPFTLVISSAGLALGLICLALRVPGGLRGENLAMVGVALCSISVGVAITLTQGIYLYLWD